MTRVEALHWRRLCSVIRTDINSEWSCLLPPRECTQDSSCTAARKVQFIIMCCVLQWIGYWAQLPAVVLSYSDCWQCVNTRVTLTLSASQSSQGPMAVLFVCFWCMQCFVSLFFDVSSSAINCPERLVSEMTYYVSSGILNPAHSLTPRVLWL